MHFAHVFAHALLHATAIVTIGFFVAFVAQKAEGKLKCIGTFLSYWLYLLAAATVIVGIFCHHGHHQHWSKDGATDSAPAEAAPAAPESPAK